jgi:hypothetical protein
MNQITRTVAAAGVCLIYFLLAAGSDTSQAKCKVTGLTGSAVIVPGNDGPDAAYRVNVSVFNEGERDTVIVKARLSSTGGEWVRERTALLDKGERETLAFVFPEITAIDDDIRYIGSCSP